MPTRRTRWIWMLPGMMAAMGAPSAASAQPRRTPPTARQPAATPPAATTPAATTPAAATPGAQQEALVDPTLADARRAYTAGTEHFNAGRYAEALASFDRAFAMRSNPVVLKPIAECHERLGNFPEAIAALERYLRELPTAPDHAQLEARLATLRQRPARVSVTSTPDGAQITVDGEGRPQRTPSAIDVAPGRHRISATLPGYRATERELEASAGAPASVDVTLEREAGGGASVGVMPPVTTPGRRVSPAVWVATAVAGAAAVAGTVFGVMALSDANDYEATPTQETLDRGQRNALLSDVGFGVSILSAGVAVVVYFAGRGGESTTPPQATGGARVQLAGNGVRVTF